MVSLKTMSGCIVAQWVKSVPAMPALLMRTGSCSSYSTSKMVRMFGPLLAIWDTQVKVLLLGFGPAQPCPSRPSEK